MNNPIFNLNGKTALITGAAGLLGLEHSLALLQCDANLVLTDINKDELIKVFNTLKNEYATASIYTSPLDVTSEESILNVSNSIKSKGIEIDILINNAAINPKLDQDASFENLSRLENFSIDEWNRQISVGLTGAFLCSKIFGTDIAKLNKGGCILNVASDLSVISPDQRLYYQNNIPKELQPVKPVTYSVLKAGLIGLTKYLATYWLESNIRCNAISPGGVFTSQSDEFVEKLSSLIPLGRMAKKDEYRAAIQFLCSDASSYMNGHNLVMDGGRSIW